MLRGPFGGCCATPATGRSASCGTAPNVSRRGAATWSLAGTPAPLRSHAPSRVTSRASAVTDDMACPLAPRRPTSERGWNQGHLVVRGSPDTIAKLMQSSRVLSSQYTYRSQPANGFSINVVTDLVELDELLRTPAYRTRHHYRRGAVAAVANAGFTLLASFTDPTHYTVLLEP